MSYLDEAPLDESNKKVQDLIGLLATAYPDRAELEMLTAQVGLSSSLLPQADDMWQTWRKTMRILVSASLLRNLVELAASDSIRRAYWPKLNAHLEATEGKATPTPPATDLPAEGTESGPIPTPPSTNSPVEETGSTLNPTPPVVNISTEDTKNKTTSTQPTTSTEDTGSGKTTSQDGRHQRPSRLTYAIIAIAAILVVLGSIFLLPRDEFFNLTVRVHASDGVLTSGSVNLIVDPLPMHAPLNNNGEADFKNLPSANRSGEARIEVLDAQGVKLYEETVSLQDIPAVYEIQLETDNLATETLDAETPTPEELNLCDGLILNEFLIKDGEYSATIVETESYSYPTDSAGTTMTIRALTTFDPPECRADLAYLWTIFDDHSFEKSDEAELSYTIPNDEQSKTTISVIVTDKRSTQIDTSYFYILPLTETQNE